MWLFLGSYGSLLRNSGLSTTHRKQSWRLITVDVRPELKEAVSVEVGARVVHKAP